MPKFVVEGTMPVARVLEAVDATDAASLFRELHPTSSIRAIDDEPVIGFCEGCARPLTTDMAYVTDGEGVRLCLVCNEPTPTLVTE